MRLGTPGLKIGIFPSTAFEERRAFFCILGAALNLTFEARDGSDYENLTGLLLFSDSPSHLETCRESGLGVLHFCISGPQQSIPTKTVKFATSEAIHASFRGQTFNDESLTTFCPLSLQQEILAWIEGFPSGLASKWKNRVCTRLVLIYHPAVRMVSFINSFSTVLGFEFYRF